MTGRWTLRGAVKWTAMGWLCLTLAMVWFTRTDPIVIRVGQGLELGVGRFDVRILWAADGGTIAWDVLGGLMPTCNLRANLFYLRFSAWLGILALTVLTLFLFRHDRRPSKGHCHTCGYDLTGNTSGRCPECGGST
jgi:hypothetical protein